MKTLLNFRLYTVFVISILCCTSVFATTKYWIGTGTDVWGNNAKWSTISGGIGGAGAPGSGDVATFDANSGNCNISTAATPGTLTITSGYGGTITQSNTLTIGNGGASLSGGTFTGGSSAINCSGSFTISGTAFTSTSGTFTCVGNFTFSSGSFTHNSGTVTFNTSNTITGSTTFYNLTFATNVGNTPTFSIAGGTVLTAANTLTISTTNAITLNTGEIDAQGNVTVTNTASGGGGSALIKINGTGSQTLTGSGVAGTGKLPKIEIDKSSGTLTLASVISIANDWTYTQGTISFGSGTPVVDACASLNMDCQGSGGTMSFYDFTVYGGTTTLTGDMGVAHDLAINSSNTLNASSKTINLSGRWTNTGTFTSSTSTVAFVGTGLQTINKTSTESFYNLTVNKTSGRLLLNVPVTVTNNVTFTEGIIKAGSSTNFNVVDNATASGGNDSAFVYGYYKKTGNEAFTFALGDTSVSTGGYHPLSIGAPSSATDAYTARYFPTVQTQGSARDSILNYTSTCEHWHLNRDAGTSNVTVKLGWNTTSCNIDSLNDLRVAYWNGSKWKDKGGSYTGSTSIGDVVTSAAQSSFGYFIIAKKYPDANAGNDVTICPGSSTNLVGSQAGATTFNWSPSTGLSCTNCYNPTASPSSTVTYTYTVTYPSGWQSNDNVTVNVYEPGKVCCSAVSLAHSGCNNTVIPYTDSIRWFSFIADSTMAIITVQNTSVVHNYVNKIKVYSGTCPSLTQISVTDTDNTKFMAVYLAGLTQGNTYYIKTLNHVSGSDSIHYTICDESKDYYFDECDSIQHCFEAVYNGHFDRHLPGCLFGNYSNIQWDYSEVGCWANTSAAGSTTPDYFNMCYTGPVNTGIPKNHFGYQAARSDSGYAGIYAYWSLGAYQEYIQQELAQPLLNGVKYNCSFYANLSNCSDRAVDKLGMYFSPIKVAQPGALRIPFTPQIESPSHAILKDTTNWMLISGTFTATGNENFVVIGSFPDRSGDTTLFDVVNVVPEFVLNEGGYNITGMAYYYIEDVSVSIIPVYTNDTTICSGNPVQLTAANAPDIGHNWSPGATLSCTTCYNPIATPLTTTTYIDSIDYNGCFIVDSVTVTVNPTPAVGIVSQSGTFNMCEPNDTMFSSPSNPPSVKYFWSIDTGQGTIDYGGGNYQNYMGVNWTGSSSSWMKLTVTDTITGCSATDSVLVNGCCRAAAGPNIINIPGGVHFVGNTLPNPVYTGQTIYINGTLVVDSIITFAGCELIMGPQAKIVVDTNMTLTDNSGTPSYLHACDYMWDGMYVSSIHDTLLRVLNGTIIEDAENAIVSTGGGLFAVRYGSTFNKNWIGIKVDAYAGTHLARVWDCTFQCYDGLVVGKTFSGAYSDKVRQPHADARSYAGITVQDVDSIFLGKPISNNTGKIYFTNLDFGIIDTNSTLSIVHSEFNYIDNSVPCLGYPGAPPCPIKGYGVYAVGNSTGYPDRWLYVGGKGSNASNIFRYCTNGVYAERYMNTVIDSNGFYAVRSDASPIQVLSHAIRIRNCHSKTHFIEINEFHDCQRGILLQQDYYVNAMIRDNNFQTSISTAPAYYAISVQNVMMPRYNYTGLHIEHNYISKSEIGIYGLRAPGLIINGGNYINSVPSMPSTTHYGIRIDNSFGCLIDSNLITKSGSLPNDTAYPKRLIGISVESSPYTTLSRNVLNAQGSGIRFFNTTAQCYTKCNQLTDCHIGFRLENSYINKQGSSGHASDNYWNPSVGGYYEAVKVGNSFASDWYMINNGGARPWNAFRDFGNIVTEIYTTSDPLDNCEQALPSPVHKQAQLKEAIQEWLPYNSMNSDNQYLSKIFALEEIRNNDALVSQTTAEDLILWNFRDSMIAQAGGLNDSVQELLIEESFTDATSVNSSITPANTMEQYMKDVNDVYLASWAVGEYSFTNDQRTTLTDIATDNPAYGGLAVYQARAMLDTIIHDFINDGSGWRKSHYKEETVSPKLKAKKDVAYKLYPNPNNGQMTLEYTLEKDGYFTLYDFTGRIVNRYNISKNANLKRLSEPDLSPGMYYGIVTTVDGEVTYSNKVLINK